MNATSAETALPRYSPLATLCEVSHDALIVAHLLSLLASSSDARFDTHIVSVAPSREGAALDVLFRVVSRQSVNASALPAASDIKLALRPGWAFKTDS